MLTDCCQWLASIRAEKRSVQGQNIQKKISRRLRQEDCCWLGASLGYRVRSFLPEKSSHSSGKTYMREKKGEF